MTHSTQSPPPQTLCVMGLSAIGDVCHMVGVVQLIARHRPGLTITWIIGKREHALFSGLPNIEFIVFDKSQGWRAYRQLHHQLRHRRFDVLLHLQKSIRASVATLFIRTGRRIGFDRKRAKDGQWLFTNEKIAHVPNQHDVDCLLEFAKHLGIQDNNVTWNFPQSPDDLAYAQSQLAGKKSIAITPCASAKNRNWLADRYAQLACYAIEHYGYQVVLTGGPSANEIAMAKHISELCPHPLINLVGQSSLKQLLAIISQVDCLIAPDTGPAHMATMVGTPVLSLYAAMDPRRTGPYRSMDWVVSRYRDAAERHFKKPLEKIPFGTRVHDSNVMVLITLEEVQTKMDQLIPTLRTTSA